MLTALRSYFPTSSGPDAGAASRCAATTSAQPPAESFLAMPACWVPPQRRDDLTCLNTHRDAMQVPGTEARGSALACLQASVQQARVASEAHEVEAPYLWQGVHAQCAACGVRFADALCQAVAGEASALQSVLSARDWYSVRVLQSVLPHGLYLDGRVWASAHALGACVEREGEVVLEGGAFIVLEEHGLFYEGEVRNGAAHGFGRMVHEPTGCEWVGHWLAGHRHGFMLEMGVDRPTERHAYRRGVNIDHEVEPPPSEAAYWASLHSPEVDAVPVSIWRRLSTTAWLPAAGWPLGAFKGEIHRDDHASHLVVSQNANAHVSRWVVPRPFTGGLRHLRSRRESLSEPNSVEMSLHLQVQRARRASEEHDAEAPLLWRQAYDFCAEHSLDFPQALTHVPGEHVSALESVLQARDWMSIRMLNRYLPPGRYLDGRVSQGKDGLGFCICRGEQFLFHGTALSIEAAEENVYEGDMHLGLLHGFGRLVDQRRSIEWFGFWAQGTQHGRMTQLIPGKPAIRHVYRLGKNVSRIETLSVENEARAFVEFFRSAPRY